MDHIDPSTQIKIEIQTRFLPGQSDPESHRFVFSYEITITNEYSQPVQLLSRRWVVTDGNEHVQEIEGEGVIGEQPIIQPQQYYQYTSGTVLATRVGSMFGHYTMETSDGHRFNAPIPAFTLALPNALH
ncbi:Co2+/Mg2+ efflux protein ApaG [Neptunomonas antarctica]|uniref:Protein ApaG n=1 Tax=Neptunomonas antarctica TaxID=619304 RepID=A0A1N7JDS5_9GAMM|nr:Co2+/Mg2+ efflux protein ApaG [Neptunomonas antarctica]SIS47450.1 ApaG protein [Neptunomonas antarctica]